MTTKPSSLIYAGSAREYLRILGLAEDVLREMQQVDKEDATFSLRQVDKASLLVGMMSKKSESFQKKSPVDLVPPRKRKAEQMSSNFEDMPQEEEEEQQQQTFELIFLDDQNDGNGAGGGNGDDDDDDDGLFDFYVDIVKGTDLEPPSKKQKIDVREPTRADIEGIKLLCASRSNESYATFSTMLSAFRKQPANFFKLLSSVINSTEVFVLEIANVCVGLEKIRLLRGQYQAFLKAPQKREERIAFYDEYKNVFHFMCTFSHLLLRAVDSIDAETASALGVILRECLVLKSKKEWSTSLAKPRELRKKGVTLLDALKCDFLRSFDCILVNSIHEANETEICELMIKVFREFESSDQESNKTKNPERLRLFSLVGFGGIPNTGNLESNSGRYSLNRACTMAWTSFFITNAKQEIDAELDAYKKSRYQSPIYGLFSDGNGDFNSCRSRLEKYMFYCGRISQDDRQRPHVKNLSIATLRGFMKRINDTSSWLSGITLKLLNDMIHTEHLATLSDFKKVFLEQSPNCIITNLVPYQFICKERLSLSRISHVMGRILNQGASILSLRGQSNHLHEFRLMVSLFQRPSHPNHTTMPLVVETDPENNTAHFKRVLELLGQGIKNVIGTAHERAGDFNACNEFTDALYSLPRDVLSELEYSQKTGNNNQLTDYYFQYNKSLATLPWGTVRLVRSQALDMFKSLALVIYRHNPSQLLMQRLSLLDQAQANQAQVMPRQIKPRQVLFDSNLPIQQEQLQQQQQQLQQQQQQDDDTIDVDEYLNFSEE